MRFLVDMPVTPRAVEFLAERGHEAVHASSIGLSEASDAVILERARAEDRVVVTADLDYPRLLATHGGSSPGVVLVRHGNLTDEEMLGPPPARARPDSSSRAGCVDHGGRKDPRSHPEASHRLTGR